MGQVVESAATPGPAARLEGWAESAQSPSHARHGVLALLALATTINYLDRTLLSVAAPSMSHDLGLNTAMMGVVFSAFSWTYAVAQIPGGIFLDRFGARLTYFLSITVWSVFTALQTFTLGLGSLLAFRLGLGVAEAPCFPANSRILCTWFPQQERARANGVYAVGMYFGIAFLSPLLFWITAHWGWRILFFAIGSIGVVFGGVWWLLYREPQESRWANQAELDHITRGGGVALPTGKTVFAWRDVVWLFRQRQIVGASIGQFCSNCTLVFFLTWFPTYLTTERHMAWLKVGFMAVLPFVAASCGGLVGGALSDLLIKRTGSATIGRKLPIVGGLLMASLISVAAFVQSDAVVIAFMCVAFFGQGMSNLGWTLISDVAPKRLIGLTGGVFNLCTNLAGIVAPIVIGVVVAKTGSFFGGLAFTGVVAVIGALSYTFLVGDVRRVEEQSGPAVGRTR